MAKQLIQPGDRFVKVGHPHVVWKATRLIELPNLPVHVHLMNEKDDHEMQTLSEAVLVDRRQFQKVH